MHDPTLLQDLAVVLLVAAATALVCRSLKQPLLLGYLIAGVIIGPHTPPFLLVRDQESIETLAGLGVVFLLFGLGLEFGIGRLRRIGLSAGVAAVLEMGLVFWLGFEAGRLAGFAAMDALFLGAILSLASSTVATTLLRDKSLTREPFAQAVFGILVAEDILIVFVLVLLSGVAMTGSLALGELLSVAARFVLFAGATLTVGALVVPRLVGWAGRARRDELLLLTAIAICFGLALLAGRLGYSVALGAFVAGATMAESSEAGRIEHVVAPVRDLFGAVFFVAIGMLIDPRLLVEQAGLVLALVALLVVGKTLAVAVGAFLTGLDLRTALRAGMSVAQIGEFSFVIAQLGVSLGVTRPELHPIAVAVSAISIFLSPHLIDLSDGVVGAFERAAPARLVRGLAAYTRRVRLLAAPSQRKGLRPIVRRSLRIVAVNVAAISLLFVGAALAYRRLAPRLDDRVFVPGDLGGVVWLGAALLALPFFVATWRKTEALVMLLAEAALPRRPGGHDRPGVDRARRRLVQTLLVVASTAIFVWLLALSRPLLPRWPLFLAPLALVTLLVPVLWTTMIRFYGRMQVRIEEALRGQPQQASETRAALVDQLSARRGSSGADRARMLEVRLAAASPGAGRTIGELDVRRRTGASVVEVHRGDSHVVNPGPAEVLLPGDAVLLLGRDGELSAARALLEGGPADGARGV